MDPDPNTVMQKSTFMLLYLVFRTILLSVISLLNEPNTFSPANVDASVMFRKWRDSKGKDNEYEKIVKWVMCFISNSSSTYFKAVLEETLKVAQCSEPVKSKVPSI